MLFEILKLFGLDVPAKIAAARTEFEHRVEDAADYAKQATLTAALVAAFSTVAAFLFIVAAGVGLFALYRVIAVLRRLRWTGCRGRAAHCGGIRTASRRAYQSTITFRASFC
jgi:hypothetical protein